MWASNTVGQGGIRLEMQASDGNLVLYDAAGVAVWNSNTVGHPGAFAQMQDDGNLVIVEGTTHIWETRTAGPSILPSGEFLGVDQDVTSHDSRYQLTLQKDGNLVVYDGTTGVWASNTVGQGGIRLEMQASDGNLVLYDAAGVAVWNSNTVGHPGAFAQMQDDGNLVIVEGTTHIWETRTAGPSILPSGEFLGVDQHVTSPDSRYQLTLQKDGNLVVYDGTTGVWASNTVGQGGIRLEMQASDGNLVLYDAAGVAVWDSNTVGHPGALAQMQDDGILVILDGTDPIWDRPVLPPKFTLTLRVNPENTNAPDLLIYGAGFTPGGRVSCTLSNWPKSDGSVFPSVNLDGESNGSGAFRSDFSDPAADLPGSVTMPDIRVDAVDVATGRALTATQSPEPMIIRHPG